MLLVSRRPYLSETVEFITSAVAADRSNPGFAATVVGPATQGSELLDKRDTKDDAALLCSFLHTGLIGFDVEVGSFIVRPELLRLLKQGKNRDANQDDLALAV